MTLIFICCVICFLVSMNRPIHENPITVSLMVCLESSGIKGCYGLYLKCPKLMCWRLGHQCSSVQGWSFWKMLILNACLIGFGITYNTHLWVQQWRRFQRGLTRHGEGRGDDPPSKQAVSTYKWSTYKAFWGQSIASHLPLFLPKQVHLSPEPQSLLTQTHQHGLKTNDSPMSPQACASWAEHLIVNRWIYFDGKHYAATSALSCVGP